MILNTILDSLKAKLIIRYIRLMINTFEIVECIN